MYLEKRAQSTSPLPPLPYSLKPSGTFDGNDGKWSTFFINIGDDSGKGNGQNFKVLISTSSPLTLVPAQTEWCLNDCPKARGILPFNNQQPLGVDPSIPWQDAGLNDLPLPYWWKTSGLTLTPNDTLGGIRALQSLGLGESSSQSDILLQQSVVKYVFKDFFLGSLGLAVGAVGTSGGSTPNFLDNFAGGGTVASKTFGYTAGASYRNNNKGALGSLVLGGYDKARINGQNITIEMPNTSNNTLVVGVQSVLYAPNQNVEANSFSFTSTSGGFYANIDSTIPYLVLPDRICDLFAQRFRLTYNELLRSYTVNQSSHDFNVQQNATVSFKIGAGTQDSPAYASVVLPYAAFDQQIDFPITDSATQYFPIKRSANGVFVLGRTFLQEAYIVVDYERSKFTVAPANSPDPLPDQRLVTIFNASYTGLPPPQNSGGGFGAGAIAGIVVGIVVAFIVAGFGAFLFWKRRRGAKKKPEETEKPSEIDTVNAGEEVKHRRVSELTGSEVPHSPKDSTTGYYNGDNKSIPPINELSPETSPAEMYSPPPDGRDTFDYFVAGRMRRRRATRDKDTSGHNTPSTPIAELPGDEGRFEDSRHPYDAVSPLQSPKHSRGPSDTSLATNIDEVLSPRQEAEPRVGEEGPIPAIQPGSPATTDEIAKAKASAQPENSEHGEAAIERRPSHARGLSDVTIHSDSTAVSQPSPEELERWARAGTGEPERPMSPEEEKRK